jgi:hypothetical protein
VTWCSPYLNCFRIGFTKIPSDYELATQTQSFDKILVTINILALEVVQQFTTLIDQTQKTTTGVVILFVLHKMRGQVVDAGGQQSHLDLGGTRVIGGALVVFYDSALFGSGIRHFRLLKTQTSTKHAILTFQTPDNQSEAFIRTKPLIHNTLILAL